MERVLSFPLFERYCACGSFLVVIRVVALLCDKDIYIVISNT